MTTFTHDKDRERDAMPPGRKAFAQKTVSQSVRRGLSREESARYLGISASKFDELRKSGRVGPPKLIDARKVWDIIRLDEAFEAFPEEGGGQDEIEHQWKAEL